MFDRNEILELGKSYTFDVSVRDENKLFAGKLTLSPSKCTLRVMGERRPSLGFSQSEKIECSSFHMSFFLYDLTINYQSSQCLRASIDDDVGFFEFEFEVGYVVCAEGYFHSFDGITSLSIDSCMTKKWVGYTNLQQELIERFHNHTLNPVGIDTVEFSQDLDDYGQLLLFYNFEAHNDVDAFTSGMKFPPVLRIKFNSPISIEDSYCEYQKLYDLMTFLIGSDFNVNSIKLSENRGILSSKVSLYFPTTNRTYEKDYPVFPLSRNLRFHDLPIPELPLCSFKNYYLLPENERITFTRYLRYRRMKSDEERFLGYFRLLESLTYKSKPYVDQDALDVLLNDSKSYIIKKLKGKGRDKDIQKLIDRIGKLNQSKYNTSKCLIDFYATLPSVLKEAIDFNNQEIEKICRLRNDITHANSYSVDESKLNRYISFINMLLYVALLEKIGIKPELSSMVVNRLDGGYHIQNHSF
ncbi:HEPN domain-containing protein [Photobacterium piscicola]|uniref:ApeA N-terminal domain 1-containing protein n=1 Tax=Photobacterium piscicola TaxID=1378299 RepID=UPI002E181968|nr:HEPN domain-containing protein [Photobacterium piscicola]